MNKYLIFLILISLLSCNLNVQDQGLLGTWNYTVEDAPFGFQKGKVIFYEENDSIKAKLKVYGLSIPGDNLVVEETRISFTTQVEHEQISIKLKVKGDSLIGTVQGSDLVSSIEMIKRRRGNRDKKDKINRRSPNYKSKDFTAGRRLLKEDMETVSADGQLNYKVHTFYYGWYANEQQDGQTGHWNSGVIPHWIDSTWNDTEPYPGGDDIGANFYPQLGTYSSTDPEIISEHMQQIREAGIGVVVISWWGKDSFTDKSVQTLLDTAHNYGIKLAFHIEPYYKTVAGFRENLEYISTKYNHHPAIYKIGRKPIYYLYNSFQLKYTEWQSMLNPDSASTIRNTALDGVFIGLWTTGFDGDFAVQAGFDGFYTYFASDGFAFGSTTSNWPDMASFARKNNLIYIPSVGPGYIDTRIRPWNDKNTKRREKGRYYKKMFEDAVKTDPDFISITSFNEWHEGTQIEPAIPKKTGSYTYEDYGSDMDPYFYIYQTKALIKKYESTIK